MVRKALLTLTLGALFVALLPTTAEAQRSRSGRRPRVEVVAWSADASVVVFAERRRDSRRIELVARQVPSGDVVAHTGVFPGPCAQVIDRRVAIAHACALAELRPRLPSRARRLRFHIAANERGRIQNITLRADGSVVEHELPRLGLVLRGRTVEAGRQERTFAVLELTRLDRSGEGRVLDRRPVRPRARRRWTLLQAGENSFILVGRGVLRRIRGSRRSPPTEPRSDVARVRPNNG